MKVRVEFKLADMWVGVFWRRAGGQLDIWLCLMPTLPLHITIGGA